MASPHSLETASLPAPSRSNSVHSNGLTRRPRIRGRTATFTDGCSRSQTNESAQTHTKPPFTLSSEPPPMADFLVAEPVPTLPPPLPLRSPRRSSTVQSEPKYQVAQETERRDRKASTSSARSGRGARAPTAASLQDLIDLKNAIAGKRSASMPRHRPPPLSTPTQGAASGAHGKNDSVQTRVSNTSSSLYPQSPHTVIDTSDSNNQHSQTAPPQDDCHEDHVSDMDSDSPISEQYDGDDVSYRLRLLVSNSYFLPPAHSKPIPNDLVLPMKGQKSLSRPGAPTFLDLFRLGKSKSRPSTSSSSTTIAESTGPTLRTTSEGAATFPGYSPGSQARPRGPKPGGDPTGRVVVVREIMEDLILAAKEAEQDMKVREWRNSQILTDAYPDAVDPTDAVDLPPPSADYPFAIQSAADYGLGVQQSVGAADLADRLPPSGSVSPDDAWRKALLQEAVGHSLSNSPAESMMFPGAAGTLSPTASINAGRLAIGTKSPAPAGPSQLKRTVLNRRIISQLVLESDAGSSVDDVKGPTGEKESSRHLRGLSQTPDSHLRTSTYIPRRAETPAALHAPLAPPPRAPPIGAPSDLRPPISPGLVRKVHSLPSLADSFQSSRPRRLTNLSQTPSHVNPTQHINQDSVSTASSYYTDADQGPEQDNTRPSVALSAFQLASDSNRPSFSDLDRPSPAMSAFRDVQYGQYTSSSHYHDSTPDHSSSISHDSPLPRMSTMSPPPRASTAMSTIPLFPPPRTSSLHYKVVTTAATPSPTSTHFSNASIQPHTPRAERTSFAQLSPPLAQRRGAAGPAPLLLNPNSSRVAVSVHSAPPPASPASFFDNITDGMQDLETTDDSDTGDGLRSGDSDSDLDSPPLPEPFRPRAMSNALESASPRSKSFMFARFGNQSTPNIGKVSSPLVHTFSPTMARFKSNNQKPPPSMLSYQAISNEPGRALRNLPIGNIPPRPSFFSSKKGGKSPKKLNFLPAARVESPPPLPTLAMDDHDPFGPLMEPGRVFDMTTPLPSPRPRSNTQDESLRKLDGLMVQHMEAEKDRIRKIARTLHQKRV
ncbi:hypothetical protein HWV62_22790 [Athelia sp. TMB]|nr:hypothetical protein HWV62_22790 [Athelia sp. TMB]